LIQLFGREPKSALSGAGQKLLNPSARLM